MLPRRKPSAALDTPELDETFMRRALALAARGYGRTSPNPMVGAVLARDGQVLGEGWHRRAGQPHAEINALASAHRHQLDARGATLYVTLEPCSTFGRTPPCVEAIARSGVARVVVAATDPNPRHRGAGFKALRQRGIEVRHGLMATEASRLNEAFEHWVTGQKPFVIAKCALSLDGRIATNTGESKWITGARSRALGLRLRLGGDAIIAGINTILRDDPALTARSAGRLRVPQWKRLRRVILDPRARLPLDARVLAEDSLGLTTVVVSPAAPAARVRALEKRTRVWVAPVQNKDPKAGSLDLDWVLRELGREEVTCALVEGGGETHASFFAQKLVQRVCFFYAPIILGGRAAPRAIGGEETFGDGHGFQLRDPVWRKAGADLTLTALVHYTH